MTAKSRKSLPLRFHICLDFSHFLPYTWANTEFSHKFLCPTRILAKFRGDAEDEKNFLGIYQL